MDEYVYEWRHEGEVITFSWMGERPVALDRVYALAFNEAGEVLLVGDASGPPYWLPGGGIEAGESPIEALLRELAEEASATVLETRYLGAQRVDSPPLPPEYHGFYWCRVVLEDDFVPQFEISARSLVPPEAFLDTLFWGRSDPKAALLLEKALHVSAQL